MANRKITELTALTGANATDTDVFAIVDVSADETKKMTLGELKEAFDSGSGFVRITGDTMTGDLALSGADVTFGDNDKAIFGAGSDLQIYHDSATGQSIISESGAGSFIIKGTNLFLQSADGQYMFRGNANGASSLYYNGSPKLATTSTGIDVTGGITADGLTVDGNTVFSGGSLGGGGNNESSIAAGLSAGRLVSDAGTINITAWNTTFNDDVIEISAGASANYVSGIAITPRTTTADAGEGVTLYRRSVPALKVDGNGDISFYEDTGTTPKFFWDAIAERLGIGVTSPQVPLDVNGDIYARGASVFADEFKAYSGSLTTYGSNTSALHRFKGNVGIGTSSPKTNLDLSSSTGPQITLTRSDTSNNLGDTIGRLNFYNSDLSGDGANNAAIIEAIANTATGAHADLLFRTKSTGVDGADASEAMRIDSSGNVGIGTSSPAAVLTSVNSGPLTLDSNDGDNSGFGLLVTPSTITANTVNSAIGFARDGGRKYAAIGMQTYDDVDQTGLNFYVQETASGSSAELSEAMRIVSSGNVGIGTSSPSSLLEVSDVSGNPAISITADALGVSDLNLGDENDLDVGRIRYAHAINSMIFNTNGSEAMRIDSSGRVGIGTSSPVGKLDVLVGGDQRLILSTLGTDTFISAVNGDNSAYKSLQLNGSDVRLLSGGAERMRIDASGNLLVGKTSTNLATAGHTLWEDGRVDHTRDSSFEVMILNKLNNDGNIVTFRKDGTTVGSIGIVSGTTEYLTIGGGGSAGVLFHSTSVRPWNLTTNVANDDAIDLGSSSARFDDVYATNGTIQTSDRNEKQDIEALSDAEQRVAVACKGLLRKFRWKDAVAEKGDDARIHFGIIAQDLQDAFAAEGLDAGRYAMFISSTWTDEETGEERTRMGVRYSELLAFIIAAI